VAFNSNFHSVAPVQGACLEPTRHYGAKTARDFIFVVLDAFRLVVATAVCFSEAANAIGGALV
jgi:hypothetical protein